MKKIFPSLIIALTIAGSFPALADASTSTLPQRLSGRILLQVEANGEAWYVYPVNRLRYYLGRPDDAFRIMRELGLGISESDYDRFKNNAPDRLLGRIMLRVHANGEAYYVDPINKNFVFLGRPADAFRIMREKGLGITNKNLSRMPISGASVIPPNGVINIIMNQPAWNSAIQSPITVSGQARVFENTVNIRVRNANDRILADTFTTASAADIGQFGNFERSVSFTAPGTSTGYVETFSISAEDGSEINKVITLVRFQ
jgi:hypothetical protein